MIKEANSDESPVCSGGHRPPLQQPVETRELRQTVAEQAKALARSALELEQAALFDEEPFEEGLLLPNEEIAKRYTGKNGKDMLWRKETAIYMLARQCPAQDIARLLHMNLRVIAALASQNGKQLAGFTEAFAQELLGSAAGDIALAETKKHDASYKDLNIGAGIKMTHAVNLKLAGMGGAMDNAIELEAENEKLAQAREFLKRLKPAQVKDGSSEPSRA